MTPYLWVCLGISIGLGIAVVFDMTFRRCWHEWNWHTYTEISIYAFEANGNPYRRKTQVSASCRRCGKPKTKTLRGIVEPPPKAAA